MTRQRVARYSRRMAYSSGLVLDGHRFAQLAPLFEARNAIRRECAATLQPGSRTTWVTWPSADAFGGDGRWMVLPFTLASRDHSSALGEIDLDVPRAACPATWQAIRSVPDVFTTGFSMLEPGTQIWAHCDAQPAPHSLRAHLVLDAPPNAWLRMGDELHRCVVDDLYVMDGRIDHQAANLSNAPRTVLLVDFALTHAQAHAHEAWIEHLRARDAQLFVPTPNRVVPKQD